MADEAKSSDPSKLQSTTNSVATAANSVTQSTTGTQQNSSSSFFGNMFNGLKETEKKTEEVFKELGERSKDSAKVASYSLAEIGRPFHFNENVDPNDRTYKFLSTRMNILDLYPCNYGQTYTYNSENKKSLFKYGLSYKTAMEQYREMCKNYLGLLNPPSALRVFLTDETTVSDSLSTSYKTNFFQNMADKLSTVAQPIADFARSLHSANYDKAVNNMIGMVDTKDISSAASTALSALKINTSQEFIGGIVDQLKEGASILLKGNKISLPKIWGSSDYKASFSISTKLFSPYGTPEAIKEYIIKPLTLLLILGIPHTNDMISYGRPFAVTLRSWGTAYLNVASITSVTLQRGGTDTVYNIYKQPLIVNVNLNFESLVDGVAAFQSDDSKIKIDEYEQNAFSEMSLPLSLNSNNQTINGDRLPTVMPTLGTIIRSFQPVEFEGLTSGYGESKGTRETTMIGGNSETTTSGSGTLLSSIANAFTSGILGASKSSDSQTSFGSLLTSAFSTGSDIVKKSKALAGSITTSLTPVINLANTVSGGAFSKTGVGKGINTVLKGMATANSTAATTLNSAKKLNTALGSAITNAGSLLTTSTGTKS